MKSSWYPEREVKEPEKKTAKEIIFEGWQKTMGEKRLLFTDPMNKKPHVEPWQPWTPPTIVLGPYHDPCLICPSRGKGPCGCTLPFMSRTAIDGYAS
jgi:hypothetical protein